MIKLAFHGADTDTDVGEDVGVSGDFPVHGSACRRNNVRKSIARVGRVGEDPREDVGGNGGNVTSLRWQVTLCDPIWHVSSRSGAVLV